MLNALLDGVNHINIYSNGKTALGRLLSNFYHQSVKTDDGVFESVEGYWHWLGIAEVPAKEILRNMYGYQAKKVGTQLKQRYGKRVDKDFEKKILNAIQYKIYKNMDEIVSSLDLLDNGKLCFKGQDTPIVFEHYYVFNRVVDVKQRYLWMIGSIESFIIAAVKKEKSTVERNSDTNE